MKIITKFALAMFILTSFGMLQIFIDWRLGESGMYPTWFAGINFLLCIVSVLVFIFSKDKAS